MTNQTKVESFLYRTNPNNDKELQRCPIGNISWSRVTEYNGSNIISLICYWLAMVKISRFIPTCMFTSVILAEGVRNKYFNLYEKDSLSIHSRASNQARCSTAHGGHGERRHELLTFTM